MLVQCKHCQYQLDPNSMEIQEKFLRPPMARPPKDLFSIVCPECGRQEDFTFWKSITETLRPEDAGKAVTTRA